MTAPEYIQLKAFARQDGAFLAILWVATFSLYIIGVTNQLLGMVAILLMVYTPFFVGDRLGKFRDYGREGIISFKRAYAYTVFVFFYAGVLFAISTEETQQVLKQYGMTEVMDESLREMSATRPIDYALNMLTLNISLGFILGLPISLIMQRNKSKIVNQ